MKYDTSWCHICGKAVTINGAARASHMKAHVRRGEAVHIASSGKYIKPLVSKS